MKEKNVKGIIGLSFGLVAIACAVLSAIPMTSLTGMGLDGKMSFFGNINIIFALCTVSIVYGYCLCHCHRIRSNVKERCR